MPAEGLAPAYGLMPRRRHATLWGPECHLLSPCLQSACTHVTYPSQPLKDRPLNPCAHAWPTQQVCLVGSKSYNTFGSHGSDVYVDYRHFDTLEQCCRCGGAHAVACLVFVCSAGFADVLPLDISAKHRDRHAEFRRAR